MGQVVATFPGVNNVVSAIYTRTHGVLPNVATLRITPQGSLPAVNGTLTLGHGTQVSFPNCRVDQASIKISSTDGHFEQLRILDRRVWWAYAYLDGLYNLRNPDGSIRSETQKSAQQLAALLLDTLGETGYDVSALPANDYPFAHWECYSVRTALSDLCKRYGCDVDLNWANDRVRIVVLGQGTALPNNTDVQSVSFGADIAETPGRVAVCGEYVLVQSKLKLFPMALETDDTLKRLDDPTLSYAPVPGAADGGFSTVVTNPADPLPGATEDVRQRSRKSLYRYWLAVSQANGTHQVPGWQGTAHTKIEQILPLRTTLVETYENAEGVIVSKPAFLSGEFALAEEPNAFENSDPCDPLEDEPFRLDVDSGLVVTSNPIVKFGNEDEYLPADLYLTTSYHVQDPGIFQYERYTKEQQISTNFGLYAEHAPELQQTFRAVYDPTNCTTVQTVINNTTEVDALANARLAQIASQFQTVTSVTVVYRSIQQLTLDGARRQIRWSVSTRSGAHTVCSFNNEPSLGSLRRKERLRLLLADAERETIQARQVTLRTIRRKGVAL